MKIGFDAKRVFCNFTGLGNYSRNIVAQYHSAFPEDDLTLFTPKIIANPRTKPFLKEEDFNIIRPAGLQPLWRSYGIVEDIRKSEVQIYHGLSHELPVGISKLHMGKVVTIHDLIFRYYPTDNTWIDTKIYAWKWRHACKTADVIIAISEQTKQDIIDYFQIPQEKIRVIYQETDPLFQIPVLDSDVEDVKRKYSLPVAYNLYVGSVISRKNLLLIIEAMIIKNEADRIPLVIIGQGKSYKKKVLDRAERGNIAHLLHWLDFAEFIDFPFIYKGAQMMIYPSFHEGFGLPVLEAMQIGIPVITSNQSSLKEAGGDAAWLIDPGNAEELMNAMIRIQEDRQLQQEMVRKGKQHAAALKAINPAEAYHSIYQELL